MSHITMTRLRAFVQRLFGSRHDRLAKRPINASDQRRAAAWNLIR